MKEREIVTHSPIQTRPDATLTHERLMSILSAESANNLLEALTKRDRTRLDIWNTFLKHPKFDNLTKNERDLFVEELIDARYSILSKNYQIERNNRLVIRDDKEEYIKTLKEIISRLVQDGTLSVQPANFHVCKECSFVIAPKEASITICPNCQSLSIGTARMNGMFLNIDNGKMTEFETRGYDVLSKEGRNRVKSSMLTMPLTISTAKHRTHGVGLTEFGVSPELKLDPKIAIALSGAVAREAGIGEVAISIQGIDSLKNNVPFTLLLDPETRTKFLNIGMVPSFSTPELEKYGSLFFFPYLAMVIAGKSKKMTGEEIQSLHRQFSKTKTKLSSCIQALKISTEKYASGDVLSTKDELNRLNEAIQTDLKDGKFRDAIEAMQNFIFDWISRVYINQCRESSSTPDPELLKYIHEILNPIFIES